MLASLNGEKKARSENILNFKMHKRGGGIQHPPLDPFQLNKYCFAIYCKMILLKS